MADLRQNFIGLILDETDPRLIGCTKTYSEVRFTPSAEEFLTTTSDFETKIRVIQRDLLYKKVRYADWTMHLATLCDDAMELALRGPDNQFLSWSDAMYEIFAHTDFMLRSCDRLNELHALKPTTGQSFRAYFDLLFVKAETVRHFPVHGTLFAKIHEALKFDYPTLLTSQEMKRLDNVKQLRLFLFNHLPEHVVFQGKKDNSSTTSLFAIQGQGRRVADQYRCNNCHCPKCKTHASYLKEGYCINCSCPSCKKHRVKSTRYGNGYKTSNTNPPMRINKLGADNLMPQSDIGSPVSPPGSTVPEPQVYPIFASEEALNPNNEDNPDDEFESLDLPSAEYIHYGYIDDKSNELLQSEATPSVNFSQIDARHH